MEPISVAAYRDFPCSPPHGGDVRVGSPTLCMDMAVDDDLLVNPKPMMEEPQVDYRVDPIPDTVPDENLEKYFQNAKSKLEKYGTTITLNAAEQTLTFVPAVSKWNPGPALNKYGKFEITTFTVPFPENRATKLKHVWPDVEEFLYEFGISCNLNLAECSMQVSTTTFLGNPDLLDRARHLLQLLSTSLVPPYMALEIFQGSRQHEIMEIGDQQGGLCTKFGVKKVGSVNGSFISSMSKGALLVNFGPGGLLNYEACLCYLESGHLGGLGIDVAWTEPFDPDDPILKFANVLITPQVAGVTEYSYRSMSKVVGDVAIQFHEGKPLTGLALVN